MAHEQSQMFPLKGVAVSLTWRIRLYTTANPLTGSVLTNLRATISKDGSAFSATTNAPVQIGTTGIGTLLLTASEMDANKIIIQVLADDTGAVNDYIQIEPLRMADVEDPYWTHTYPRLEQLFAQLYARFAHTVYDNGTIFRVLKRGTSDPTEGNTLVRSNITQDASSIKTSEWT